MAAVTAAAGLAGGMLSVTNSSTVLIVGGFLAESRSCTVLQSQLLHTVPLLQVLGSQVWFVMLVLG